MQRGVPPKREGTGLLPMQRVRLERYRAVFTNAGVLCVAAAGHTGRGDYPIALLELLYFTSLSVLSHSSANSVPRTRAFQGFRMPNVSLANGSIDLVTNVKLRILQSPVDTVVACIAV